MIRKLDIASTILIASSIHPSAMAQSPHITPVAQTQDFSASKANGSNHIHESEISGDLNGIAKQEVILDNGVKATIKVDNYTDTVEISADNGEHYVAKLSELRSFAQNGTPVVQPYLKPINSCPAATGIAGIAHAALWGGALGGAPGIAAGAAVGAYWWLIGTQC